MTGDGELLSMKYAVADVSMPLDSVSQICDTGAQVLFTKWGGYIMRPTGRVDFKRVNDTYVRSTWVRRPRKGKKTTNEDVEMTQAQLTSTKNRFGRHGAAPARVQ